MKMVIETVLFGFSLSIVAAIPASAQSGTATVSVTRTREFEGISVKARGSINPPNIVDECNKAKKDATNKARSAGYNGSVTWKRLSNDSDCSLNTGGARGAGYIYTFKALGKFNG